MEKRTEKPKSTFDLKRFLSETNGAGPGQSMTRTASFSPKANRQTPFFHVHKGKVKLSVVSKQGKEAVIAGPQHVLFHVLPEAMGPSAGEA